MSNLSIYLLQGGQAAPAHLCVGALATKLVLHQFIASGALVRRDEVQCEAWDELAQRRG